MTKYVEEIAIEQGKYDELIGDNFPINVLGSYEDEYEDFITNDKERAILVQKMVLKDLRKTHGNIPDLSVDIIPQKNGCFKISFFK